jgi:hypothetical protein
MKNKIWFYVILLVVVSLFGITGCDRSPNSDQTQKKQMEELVKASNDSIGMPAISNYFEKKTLKYIFELRDNPKLVTYSYTQGMDGRFIYLGKSVGFGFPYSTQYTNPEKLAYEYSYQSSVLKQADPNALFSPESAEASWFLPVDPKTGQSSIGYFEPKLAIFQFKLEKRLLVPGTIPDNYDDL